MAHRLTINTTPLLLFFFLHFSSLPTRIAATNKVPAVIVFGDSSVDAGNNNQITTVLKSNFQPYGRDLDGGRPTGRFCNGRIATDFISEAFGIKREIPAYLDTTYSIKDFATGVSFASAGTGFDNATSDVLNVIPLWKELDYFRDYKQKLVTYAGPNEANRIITEALYVISAGTNDFMENYYTLPTRSSRLTIQEYESFLLGIVRSFITEIYHMGGRKMSLTSLPPMGCLPLERSTNFMRKSVCRDDYNALSRNFNMKLKVMAEKLRADLPGMRVVLTDVYHIWMQVTDNPSLYGMETVAVGCCASGMFEMGYLCDRWNPFTCTDASKYMFWDSFHPTEKMYSILAHHAMTTSLAEFL
ncbi:GDSL esterase/lipase At2g04570-like [Aristolochia californica]|uniref:GDSL esterase/lipase At2g04570-like n=1 Tax=Aristolochia californica TaxID=171875 RepID=UPI0035DF95E4